MTRSSDVNVCPFDLSQDWLYPHPNLFPDLNKEELYISRLEITQPEVNILLDKEAKLSAKIELLERVLDDMTNQKKKCQVKFEYFQAQILAGGENAPIALRCANQSKYVVHNPPQRELH